MMEYIFLIALSIAAYQDWKSKLIRSEVCAWAWIILAFSNNAIAYQTGIWAFAISLTFAVLVFKHNNTAIGWADVLLFPPFFAFASMMVGVPITSIITSISLGLMLAFAKIKKEKKMYLIPFLLLAYAIVTLINLIA